MHLIEANITHNIECFLLRFVYCHICRLGNFMEDFSYSVKNARIDFNDLLHETFTKVSEVLTAQKKLGS